MRTQESRGRGLGSQEWPLGLEVPVGMLSWTQRQGDDSAGTMGKRCPWDGRKAAVIPSQLLGNCKGRGLEMQLTPAEGWWLGSSRCEGGSRCVWLWEGSWIGGGQPPAERASLASALPGCSTRRQRCCLPPHPSLHLSSLGIWFYLFIFFVGRDDGGRCSIAQPLP